MQALVIFDCDGVLVDSEPITNRVLRDMLEELGWVLSPAECMRIFVGKAVKDVTAALPDSTEAKDASIPISSWPDSFRPPTSTLSRWLAGMNPAMER